MELLSRALWPESVTDIVLTCLSISGIVISFLFGFKFIKPRLCNLALTMAVLLVSSIGYWLVQTQLVPKWQRFPDGKIGVLLPGLAGHQLAEHFGTQKLNDALAMELRIRLEEFEELTSMHRLDTLVFFKPISWRASTPGRRRGAWEEVPRLGCVVGGHHETREVRADQGRFHNGKSCLL